MDKKVIVFQGDSITDCGRNRENDGLGLGYANMVSGTLMATEPYQYKCHNRGISGNRVVDLYARIRVDMINLKPDYMSILIGVNDVWHEVSKQNGVDAEKYNLLFVPLQEMFSAAEATAPAPGYWLRDGVHPTVAGHELIKQAWLKAFQQLR